MIKSRLPFQTFSTLTKNPREGIGLWFNCSYSALENFHSGAPRLLHLAVTFIQMHTIPCSSQCIASLLQCYHLWKRLPWHEFLCLALLSRAVGRSENLKGLVVIQILLEKKVWFLFLPKSGGAIAPPATPKSDALTLALSKARSYCRRSRSPRRRF